LEHYANTIIQRKKELLCISKYVVADAYFSKHGFISTLSSNGFETVSRLRNDADLKYLYKDEQKKGKGRPKKYDGKINYNDLKESYFTKVERNSKRKIYHAIVFSKSLKRKINLVIVFTNKKGKWNHKLYFCTDLEIDSATVLRYYQTRFQIEFTFRDAKQHTRLNHCQARSENKLYFHFNTALTTINLAKITHWIPIQKELRGPFSMVNIKTMYHNELLLNRFFSVFGIRRNLTKNKEKFKELLYYGARAA
jgi:hypothetical protein